jgi:hypothetical protein
MGRREVSWRVAPSLKSPIAGATVRRRFLLRIDAAAATTIMLLILGFAVVFPLRLFLLLIFLLQ